MALKVIYLFGAGATQAVLRSSTSSSLLTADIQSKIQGLYSSKGFNKKVWSELTTVRKRRRTSNICFGNST